MTFKTFLKRGLKNDDFGYLEIDFAKDFFRPRGGHDHKPFEAWKDLHRFLEFMGACDEALKSGKVLFKKWQKQEQKRIEGRRGR